MPMSIPLAAEWPKRLQELCRQLQSPRSESDLETTQSRAWRLIVLALSMYLRLHAGRLGPLSREEIEDLAAEKSLDLLRRIVSGRTDLADRSPAEISRFFSKVARNDLLDFLQERGRRVEPSDESRPRWDVGETAEGLTMGTTDSPELLVERKEFARALRGCAEQLDQRSRTAWFFRVFYAMSSKEIAAHPGVGLKVGHVDVVLQRARTAIRDCMRRRGFEPEDMPTGTFVELWEAFRPGAAHSGQGAVR